MTVLHAFAPAKINLYLHVTGRREDGFHILDSLVAFTDIGDSLCLESSEGFHFALEGPMARELRQEPHDTNLAVRAVRLLADELKRPLNIRLTLTKNLPVASGIGGGSSDAAAALRLLAQHWGVPPTDAVLGRIAASLGQDVPCCLAAETCYFCGIGDVTEPGPLLPPVALVLVNPNKPLSTPAVFSARKGTFTEASRFESVPQNVAELAGLLHARTNSLTEAASQLVPEIKAVLSALAATPQCQIARMSGSGATCFGLYPDRSAARKAAAELYAGHPEWWSVAGFLPYKGIPS